MGKVLNLEEFNAKIQDDVARHIKSVSFKEGHSYVFFLDEDVDDRVAGALDEALRSLNVAGVLVYIDDVRNVKCVELKRKVKK
jgi:hypothetical protein